MRNTVLSLLVASGLLLGGSAAYARVDGKCQSIGARGIGAFNQIVQGINLVNNCNAILASQFEFLEAGCSFEDDVATGGPILKRGRSCNLVATICDGVEICFDVVLDFCVDVPACTIP